MTLFETKKKLINRRFKLLISSKVPKSGYLNVNDFRSVKDLAERMISISQNKTAYNSFFRWKEHVTFQRPIRFSTICHMCIQLNLERHLGVKKSVVKSIKDYWSVENNCKLIQDIV